MKRIIRKITVFAIVLGLLLPGCFIEDGGNLLSVTVKAASYYTVSGTANYLALRWVPGYDAGNEIGKLYNGESVEYLNSGNGSYWYVYSPKLGMPGYVNKKYLVASDFLSNPMPLSGGIYRVTGTTNYLALRSAATYDARNEIGKLYNGDTVEVQNRSGSYWYVYSPQLGKYGYVNSKYLCGFSM